MVAQESVSAGVAGIDVETVGGEVDNVCVGSVELVKGGFRGVVSCEVFQTDVGLGKVAGDGVGLTARFFEVVERFFDGGALLGGVGRCGADTLVGAVMDSAEEGGGADGGDCGAGGALRPW